MSNSPTPISIAYVAGWRGDGTPVARIESAICASCDNWATRLWVGREITATGDMLTESRTSRVVQEVVYSCNDHSENLAEELMSRYLTVSNSVEDELAEKVERITRAKTARGAL